MQNGTLAVASELVDAELVDETANRPGPDAQAIIDGLLSLAVMIEKHPELVDDGGPLRFTFNDLNVFVENRAQVAALARLGMRSRAKATKHQNAYFAGVNLDFGRAEGHRGRVRLCVNAEREEICERVVTGTREVTEEVPDPEQVAAVPKVTVTRTEEIVEWKCRPILPDELPAAGVS